MQLDVRNKELQILNCEPEEKNYFHPFKIFVPVAGC
jgi:hypothetical protein